MKPFAEILSTNGPVRYSMGLNGHLRMYDTPFPLSIKEPEFIYLTEYIVANKLTRGFEVATAFGISALAAATGFAETGGRLISMDAYVEEKHKSGEDYRGKPDTFVEAAGFKSALFLASYFDVDEHVDFAVGWSPTDVPQAIRMCHGNEKLDYVFIDGGHFPEQVCADVDAIAPFVKCGASVFFHDVYPEVFTKDVTQHIARTLGSKIDIVVPLDKGGDNLGLLIVNS